MGELFHSFVYVLSLSMLILTIELVSLMKEEIPLGPGKIDSILKVL